jgi:hypothetical protein
MSSGDVKFSQTYGVVIPASGVYAKEEIYSHLRSLRLDGNELNKTFHKSWAKVQNSSRYQLAIEQILHYLSTYGTMFEGEIYIPDEVLDIPEVTKLKVNVIQALPKAEIVKKCLDVLRSGIALKEATLNAVFELLKDLEYSFKGNEGIRNKEALIKIADWFGIYPKDQVEFLRYLVFKATASTLLIKDRKTLEMIKASSFNPGPAIKAFGEKELSEIFNRFKPIFLAFKSKCPSEINKLSRYSKTYHKPMYQNPINLVTSELLNAKDPALKNATTFALFKALQACYSRLNGQEAFTYHIRNGRSYTVERKNSGNVMRENFTTILIELSSRLPKGKSVYIPEGVVFALPTSEKMFIGNIPTGTTVTGESLNVGIYWRNEWGARDLDLSAMSIDGKKVGWNATYHNEEFTYSGDVTSAPNGAVEYLRVGKIKSNYLLNVNVFSGQDSSKYKIIVGKGSDVDKNYMMDPNKVDYETLCETPQKQTCVGLVSPVEGNTSKFTFFNFGSGNMNVSGDSEVSRLRIKALVQRWEHSPSLNQLFDVLGWHSVETPDEADYNLSFDNLTKDTFLDMFKTEEKLNV